MDDARPDRPTDLTTAPDASGGRPAPRGDGASPGADLPTSDATRGQDTPVEEGLDLDLVPGGARAAVEAVLMVAEDPVSVVQLVSVLVLPRDRVTELVTELAAEYTAQQRGFELREVAGGWRVFSRAELAPVVRRFVTDGQTARLTQAALETLAVIAYRQPVSRARVAAIRGVSVDSVVRTLTVRGLVSEVGQDPQSGAVLYGTTTSFLERMGLGSVDDLPALAPYLPDVDVLEDLVDVVDRQDADEVEGRT